MDKGTELSHNPSHQNTQTSFVL